MRMYAGIGYFTIPFIKGGAAHVHACELNPNRFAAWRCWFMRPSDSHGNTMAASQPFGRILKIMAPPPFAQCECSDCVSPRMPSRCQAFFAPLAIAQSSRDHSVQS
jgi:hypothetical protein